MTGQLPEIQESPETPVGATTPQAARAGLGLIALLFIFPLVLMLVTSIVCIAVVLAKH
jgi:hypothetical protein